jgi:hypothetical protein
VSNAYTDYVRWGLRREHVVRGVLLVCADGSVVKVDNILVLLIIWTITCDIESRCAGRVLGELVSPEDVVWGTLVNPVFVHYPIVKLETRTARILVTY